MAIQFFPYCHEGFNPMVEWIYDWQIRTLCVHVYSIKHVGFVRLCMKLPYLWFLMFLLLWNIGWFSLQHFEFRLLRVSALSVVTETTEDGQQYAVYDVEPQISSRLVTCHFLFWSGYDFTSTRVKFFLFFCVFFNVNSLVTL